MCFSRRRETVIACGVKARRGHASSVNTRTFVCIERDLERADGEVVARPNGGVDWGLQSDDCNGCVDLGLQWDEWVAMLFHEDPQSPEWRDGRLPDALPSSHEDALLEVTLTYSSP